MHPFAGDLTVIFIPWFDAVTPLARNDLWLPPPAKSNAIDTFADLVEFERVAALRLFVHQIRACTWLAQSRALCRCPTFQISIPRFLSSTCTGTSMAASG